MTTTIWLDCPNAPGPWWCKRPDGETNLWPKVEYYEIDAEEGLESFRRMGCKWTPAVPPGPPSPDADRDAADLFALRELERRMSLPLGDEEAIRTIHVSSRWTGLDAAQYGTWHAHCFNSPHYVTLKQTLGEAILAAARGEAPPYCGCNRCRNAKSNAAAKSRSQT